MFAYRTELFDIVEHTASVLPEKLTTTMPKRKEKGES